MAPRRWCRRNPRRRRPWRRLTAFAPWAPCTSTAWRLEPVAGKACWTGNGSCTYKERPNNMVIWYNWLCNIGKSWKIKPTLCQFWCSTYNKYQTIEAVFWGKNNRSQVKIAVIIQKWWSWIKSSDCFECIRPQQQWRAEGDHEKKCWHPTAHAPLHPKNICQDNGQLVRSRWGFSWFRWLLAHTMPHLQCFDDQTKEKVIVLFDNVW